MMIQAFSLRSLVFGLGIGMSCCPMPVYAQLIPDDTLADEASQVVTDAVVEDLPAHLIEGGAVRGPNLFHSFGEFNVGTLQRVYFANPAGINTILTRVTGGNVSTIDGTLGVDGAANLYLLNPNGVVFGPNAQLDLRGAFAVSTAEAWALGNGAFFDAVNPDLPPLLTVSLTPGLQYSAAQQAEVTNAGTLQVAAGQSLQLLGETVINTGRLMAPGGEVQLLGDRVGVFDGQIDVSAADRGGRVNIGGGLQGQDGLPTARQTVVGPNATILANGIGDGDGGNIIIWANETAQFYGDAQARGGEIAGDGGFVEVSGRDWLNFQGTVDTTAVNGRVGTLLLDPTNIRVVSEADAETVDLSAIDSFATPDIGNDGDTRIAASALSDATSNVVLQATQDITFDAPVAISTPFVGLTAVAGGEITVNAFLETVSGDINFTSDQITISAPISSLGGDINLSATNEIVVDNATFVEAGDRIFRTLDAGNLFISTPGELRIAEGARLLSTAYGLGNGGLIRIRADSEVSVVEGLIATNVADEATGQGGSIVIETDELTVSDGARLSITSFGSGAAGDLNVRAARFTLDGINRQTGRSSGIDAGVVASGNGGNVTLDINEFLVTNGARISTSNVGEGNSGNVMITADQIVLDGVNAQTGSITGIGSRVFESGNGGDLVLITENLAITNGAALLTDNFGEGDSGALHVTASQIILDGVDARTEATSLISARVFESGQGGDVVLTADEFAITNGAVILTSNFGGEDSGRVNITGARITLDGISAQTGLGSGFYSLVAAIGNGSHLFLTADELVVTNGAVLSTSNVGQGNSGVLNITASQIKLDGMNTQRGVGSSIESTIFASGDGGDIRLITDELIVTNGAQLVTSNSGEGNAGNIEITASQIIVDGSVAQTGVPSQINADVFGAGNGGHVILATNDLSVTNGAQIATTNFGEGVAGDMSVVADRIIVDGSSAQGLISNINAMVGGVGDGGAVVLTAHELLITNGAQISTANQGVGDSGDVNIRAARIIVDGVNTRPGNVTGINLLVISRGNGGNLVVDVDNLAVINGAAIATTNLGVGQSGRLQVTANNRLELDGGFIFSGTLADSNSGDIFLNAQTLTVQNRSSIGASAEFFLSSGTTNPEAGGINIVADAVLIDQSAIETESTLGSGGDIDIQANSFLLLRNGSRISTNAGTQAAGGDGGNIDIRAPFVAAVLSENSDITANAFSGSGGRVTVTARDIIGLEFQDQLTPNSDITASSTTGADGVTEFNRLTNVDVQEGLSNLPIDLADPSGLINRSCELQSSANASEFSVTGRGGLPSNPTNALDDNALIEDLGPVLEQDLRSQGLTPPTVTPSAELSSAPTVITEPQGWVQAADGSIYFYGAASVDSRSLQSPPDCETASLDPAALVGVTP